MLNFTNRLGNTMDLSENIQAQREVDVCHNWALWENNWSWEQCFWNVQLLTNEL